MGGGREVKVGDGIEEATRSDEHWVLYGNQFDNNFILKNINRRPDLEVLQSLILQYSAKL